MNINLKERRRSGALGRTEGVAECFTAVWAVLVGALLAAGCASKQGGAPAIRPGEGIAEYRQIAGEAETAMRAALDALAKVSAQADRCAPEVLSDYSVQVQRVQVDSVKLRARAQAILARGDDYFENWHKYLAQVKDPAARARVKEQRPALEKGFRKVKGWSQETREAFQPFLAGLRKVRNALEKDPASLNTSETRQWMKSAQADGEHVVRCLASIRGELDNMKALLAPPGSTTQSRKDP
jgi:hypothetical protein